MRLLFLAVVAISIPLLSVSGYTFKNTKGDSFEGEILSINGDQVQLLRHSDGNRFTLSRTVFSAENQVDFYNWKSSAQDLRYGLRDGESIRALSRQLRVDLIWEPGDLPHYEVARAAQANGPWEVLSNPTPEFHLYSDYTSRLAMMEDARSLPWGAVWNEYCARQDTASDNQWLSAVKTYEKDVLLAR